MLTREEIEQYIEQFNEKADRNGNGFAACECEDTDCDCDIMNLPLGFREGFSGERDFVVYRDEENRLIGVVDAHGPWACYLDELDENQN